MNNFEKGPRKWKSEKPHPSDMQSYVQSLSLHKIRRGRHDQGDIISNMKIKVKYKPK